MTNETKEKTPISTNGHGQNGHAHQVGMHGLVDKLNDPDVSRSLVNLLDKVESIETAVSAMDEMMRKASALMESVQETQMAAKRMAAGMELLDKLTDPDVSRNLNRMLDKLDSVDIMLSALDEGMKKMPELLESVEKESPLQKRLDGGLELLDKLSDPDVTRNMVRLLDKLDTVETMLSAADELNRKAPELMACMHEDSEKGHVLDQYYELLGKLGKPQVVANFNNLLDKIENLDAVINILDEVVNRNPDLKKPHSVTVQSINELFETLMSALNEEKALLNTVKGGIGILNEVNHILLSSKMQVVVGGVAQAMQVPKEQVPEVGLFGLMKMMGNKDVKKTFGLLSVLLQSIGQRLDELDCAVVAEEELHRAQSKLNTP